MSAEFYVNFEKKHRGSNALVRQRLEQYLPLVKQVLKSHPNRKTLDLGCGRGEWLQLLASHGAQPEGVDLDNAMLADCKALGFEVRQEDALAALNRAAPGTYCMVSAFHLVEHLPLSQVIELVEQAKRVLAPGGLLIIETPNVENLTVGTKSFYLDPTHIRPVPAELLQFILEHAGFGHNAVVRLNHEPLLSEKQDVTLFETLQGVSPDYAIVAMKEGPTPDLEALNQTLARWAFDYRGLSLEGMALRYDRYLDARLENLSHGTSIQLGKLNTQMEDIARHSRHKQLAAEGEIAELQQHIKKLQSQLGDLQHRFAQHEPLLNQLGRLAERLRASLAGKVLRKLRHSGKLAGKPEPTPTHRKSTLRLLLDVSNVSRHDANTGIERVVKRYCEAFKSPAFAGIDCYTVALHVRDGVWDYQFASLKHLPNTFANTMFADGQWVEPAQGDILWMLDYFPQPVADARQQGLYSRWKAAGARLVFQIYDLLPSIRPEFFPSFSKPVHDSLLETIRDTADDVVCISHSVAKEYLDWKGPDANPGQQVHGVPLGADLIAQTDIPPKQGKVGSHVSFLTVGTLEPRKGHAMVIDALEILWSQGHLISYVIAGREGWQGVSPEERQYIAELVTRIRNHPELGKRLFWHSDCSDADLATHYQTADCVIVPSYAEGFGLPLIEASFYHTPLLVRDIPVFREIANDSATFFDAADGSQLAIAILKWVVAHKQGQNPQSDSLVWMTWEESATLASRCLKLTNAS